MKSYFLGLGIIYFFAIVTACGSGALKGNGEAVAPRDPPKVEVTLKENQLTQGLKSLKGRAVTGLFIYNLPDSYLIKSKSLFNPPDSVIQEVTNLQTDRQEWFDEMIVTYCDDCKNINVEVPLKTIPEKVLLQLIDKASLNRELTKADFDTLKDSFKGTEVFWIILGSENYEQRRGETGDGTMISALAENTVTLRSYIFDVTKKVMLNRTQLHAVDKDYVVYEKLMETTGNKNRRPKTLFQKMKDNLWPFPVGRSYDSPQYDETYPYPAVPESNYVIKKALSAVGESLNP